MRRFGKVGWRVAACGLLVVGAPVVLESPASANCLATLHATPLLVNRGSTVTLFGRNYSSNPTSSNIDIHLDGRNGRVLASFPPQSTLNGTFTVPTDVPQGLHTLVTSQFTAARNLVSCSPGRASIEVTGFRATGDADNGWLVAPSGLRTGLVLGSALSVVALLVLALNRGDRAFGRPAVAREAA